MQLRCGIWCDTDLWLPSGAEAEGLEALCALAERADATPLDLLWLVGEGTALHLAAAAVASRTGRLRLGVAGFSAEFPHPLRAAEDAATLDGIASGRLELALCDEAGSLAEGIRALREAWAPGVVTTATDARVQVHPKPPQSDALPLYVDARRGSVPVPEDVGVLTGELGTLESCGGARIALLLPDPPEAAGETAIASARAGAAAGLDLLVGVPREADAPAVLARVEELRARWL